MDICGGEVMCKRLFIYSIMALCVIALSGCGGRMDRQTGMDFAGETGSEEAGEGGPEVEWAGAAVGEDPEGEWAGAAVGEGPKGSRDGTAAGEGQDGSQDAMTAGEAGNGAGVLVDGEAAGPEGQNQEAGKNAGVQSGDRAGNSETKSEAASQDSAAGNGSIQGDTAVKNGTDGRVSGAADDTEKEPGLPGALKVIGTQLTDSRGTPVQLKGISTHGIAWYPEYVNAACFRQFREEWGMDVVRLAMYTAEYGGYCTGGNQDELKELIRDGVSCATDCGMYVIIDWHILSDGNPNTYLEEAREFFGEIAEEYAEYTNVIYEICNEPNGGVSWSDVKEYAEQIIEVIRGEDEDGLILIGTPNWCQYVEQAAADPITAYDNIMYTLHFYAATHTDSLRDAMTKAVEAGLPVFVSEYGICDASGNGAIDKEQADRWAELLDEYGISYVAWNLSNKAETSAILKSSCGKVSGFTLEDLSDSGKWLYERLGAGGSGAAGEKTAAIHP